MAQKHIMIDWSSKSVARMTIIINFSMRGRQLIEWAETEIPIAQRAGLLL